MWLLECIKAFDLTTKWMWMPPYPLISGEAYGQLIIIISTCKLFPKERQKGAMFGWGVLRWNSGLLILAQKSFTPLPGVVVDGQRCRDCPGSWSRSSLGPRHCSSQELHPAPHQPTYQEQTQCCRRTWQQHKNKWLKLGHCCASHRYFLCTSEACEGMSQLSKSLQEMLSSNSCVQ